MGVRIAPVADAGSIMAPVPESEFDHVREYDTAEGVIDGVHVISSASSSGSAIA